MSVRGANINGSHVMKKKSQLYVQVAHHHIGIKKRKRKMDRENIVKTNEQLYEDYGIGGIIFLFIELWILLSTIPILLFLALNVKGIVSIFAIPSLLFLFVFSMFKIGEVLDILRLYRKYEGKENK